MLRFDNVSLQIADKVLLNTCSGEINQGESIVITGSSGNGKSLLLKVLASLLPPSQGQITLQGKSMAQIEPRLWRSQIGFVQQQPELVEGSVLDNLSLPFGFKFYQQHRFDKTWHLEQLYLLGKTEHFLYQPVQQLSGGERQIVNLLRCLQLNPILMLLDEPTSALDSHSRQALEALILRWKYDSDTRAVVWVSHDNEQIAHLICHGARQWQMRSGTLAYLH